MNGNNLMDKYKKNSQKKSFCPAAGKCGGCQLQNMSYARQLSFKQAKVVSLLGKYAHVGDIIGMDKPVKYRNKVQSAFGVTRSGKIISGVYQSSTHNIVSIDSCMLENETADSIIVDIRKLMPSFKLTAYDERSERGFLRHVLIRTGRVSGEVMVVLVTAVQRFPSKNNFIKALLELHPEITTIVQNINDKFTSMVLGDKQTVLYGNGYITDELCSLTFRISPKSFYQINPEQTQKLYNKAMEFACLKENETVLDAYSGIGTIGLCAANNVKNVICVENNPEAVRDAKINAKLNNIENARFYCMDAGEFMTQLAKENVHIDVVFTDPPRAGCSKEFLNCTCELSPDRIVYISCNPETQARDVFYLTKRGYKVRKIQPVDQFPYTSHIENIVMLSKIKETKVNEK